jgi:hypothetical protein
MAHREVAKAINPIRLNLKWWPPKPETLLERVGSQLEMLGSLEIRSAQNVSSGGVWFRVSPSL